MTVLERNFLGVARSEAGIDYSYNDNDDLKSIRRWVKRKLSPTASPTAKPADGEPWLFIEPLEGTFRRPAITIRLVTDTGIVTQGHASANYNVEHLVVFTCYGRDRAETMAISENLWRMFWEGGDPSQARFRIPIWAFDHELRLARFMRVLPESLAMGLDETNEQGEWQRGSEVRIVAPRNRPVPGATQVTSVGGTLSVIE